MDLKAYQERVTALYEKLNRRLWGIPAILIDTFQSFRRQYGIEAAASIAFFTIFSIVPLLLVLISILGRWLSTPEAIDLVVSILYQYTPIPPENMTRILQEVAAGRQASGVVGLVTLALSASGVFLTLTRNINRAWPNAKQYNTIRGHLFALLGIAFLTIAVVAWIIFTAFLDILSRLNTSLLQGTPLENLSFSTPLFNLLPWILAFFLFLGMYRWTPATRVKWREASWGALFTTLATALITTVFTWYLHSGFARYDILYGSLSSSIALLTWAYTISTVLLIGAHLSSSIARAKRKPGTST